MTYNYRCTRKACRQRVTKRRRIEEYVHDKHRRCEACGGALSLDPAVRRQTKTRTCHCDGYHFPHHKGSFWCNHYEGERAHEDERDRAFAMMRSFYARTG